ncbi:hypothetical protein [Flexivirga alba]|uniref:Uncharacterized protein n=1 Tax=Flexivirga alba TaxID=702742 RepID=A0ABW2AKD4_9MICO
MSTTTAADLLERADLLTRTLREDDRPVTPARWAAFDHTTHRLLTELLGPHGTWIRDTRASHPLQTVIDHYPAPAQPLPGDDEPFTTASATDPHPLARLTCTLAVFADLMHQPDDIRADVLRSTAELSNVTARVLSITAVAARYTIANMPLQEAIPPLTVGRFAEDILTHLPTTPGERLEPGLRIVAAVTPSRPFLEADRLDLAIHRWDNATAESLAATIPCAEVLHTLATQGTHLYGVTARVYAQHDGSAVPVAFPAAVQSLARVDETWIHGLTTLTPPSHQFIAASRDLYEQLRRLDQQLTRDAETVEPEAVAAKLARAAHRISRHLCAAEQLPEQLIHSELMFAPARRLAPHPDRVTDHVRGRLTTVRAHDATELTSAWHAGITAARGATLAIDLSNSANRQPDGDSVACEPVEICR